MGAFGTGNRNKIPQPAQATTTAAQAGKIDLSKTPQWTAATMRAANAGDASTYDAATMRAANAGDASTYDAATMRAANAGDASTYDAATRQVGVNETVNGLVGKYLAKDSPFVQQAQTSVQQAANARGLANSSMAAGAGYQAAVNTVLPIAQADAAAYGTAARDNQLAANTERQTNAAAKNSMAQYNASNQQQANSQNQQAENTERQTNAAAKNSMAQYNASNQQQANSQNQQAVNTSRQANAGILAQAQTTNANNQQQTNTFNAQQANAQSQFNASTSNDILKTQLDTQNKEALMNIEASYKTLLQANSSAGDLYQQMVKSISDIQANKDLTADTKATLIRSQMTLANVGIGMIGTMSNIPGLSQILNTSNSSGATDTGKSSSVVKDINSSIVKAGMASSYPDGSTTSDNKFIVKDGKWASNL